MSTAGPDAPARDTGLPPGVQVGPLGRRVLAYVVDSVVPAAAGLVVGLTNGASPVLTVVLVVVALAWGVLCWRQLAVRAATPGMKLLGLQLVGFFDGRPVGWARVLLRWVVWTLLGVTGIGLLLLLVLLLTSPRHQGWHDRAVGAVVIVERPLAPPRTTARTAAASRPTDASTQTPAQVATGAPDDEAAPAPVVAAATPSVAGDPAVGPELAPLAGEPAPTAAPAHTNGAHRTILDGWVAELDDGREIAVRGLVLLGRNPQPGEGEDDAQLIKLSDESRTVSKTHLALGVDDAGLFVVDRGSTNGSTITPPGRPAQIAGPFHAVSVGEGSVVSIGDHWVRIRREG